MRVSIRTKLLILLMGIGLAPVAIYAWFDVSAARRLGADLAEQARWSLDEAAREKLLLSVQDAAEDFRRRHLLLETQVKLQARQVERALASPAPIGTQVWVPNGAGEPAFLSPSARHGGVAVSFDRVATALGTDASMAAVGALPRLQRVAPSLRGLHDDGIEGTLWHHVVLRNGARAIFPGRAGALSSDVANLPWYRATLGGQAITSSRSVDPATGLPTLIVATQILQGDNATVVGATAIEVSLPQALEAVAGGTKPERALLVSAGPSFLRIVAERSGARTHASGLILPSDAVPELKEVVADVRDGRPAIRRMMFDGEDSLVASDAIGVFDIHLVYAVPYRDVAAAAEAAQASVADRLSGQRVAVLWGLLGLAAALVGVALAVSRAVTRPVDQLASSARQLAAGDFSARTSLRSGDELQELGELFNGMVPRLRESIRMRESLGLAMEVQRDLLPQRPADVPGFDIAGLSIYCDETGGDYYDFLRLPQYGPGEVAVVVGDVAGHGIPAALLMTTARALLRSQSPERGNLAQVMGYVNRHLVEDSRAGRFMTMFLALLDSQRREVHWVSAGHDPAIIYEPEEGGFRDMPGVDIPLGVDAEWRYHELFHSGWSDGTVLVIGTDGIWETRNSAGEMFGKDAIRSLIRANAGLAAADLARVITDALAEFREGRGQRDDVTLVVVKST